MKFFTTDCELQTELAAKSLCVEGNVAEVAVYWVMENKKHNKTPIKWNKSKWKVERWKSSNFPAFLCFHCSPRHKRIKSIEGTAPEQSKKAKRWIFLHNQKLFFFLSPPSVQACLRVNFKLPSSQLECCWETLRRNVNKSWQGTSNVLPPSSLL